MPPRSGTGWRLLGVLGGLATMSFLSMALIAVVLGPLLLLGGACGLYLGLHLQ